VFGDALNLPADEIADNIGVTDQNLKAVLLLRDIGTVEVPAEGGLDTGSVSVKLLLETRFGERLDELQQRAKVT